MSEGPRLSPGAPRPPRVFLSYSHDSPEHTERVLAFADRLRAEGVDAHLDQYEEAPPEGWPLWMERQVEAADFVLVVCTETYLRRFRQEARAGEGRGVKWEGAILRQELYEAEGRNERFVPVLLDSAPAEHIPQPLRGVTHYRLDGEAGYEASTGG